MHLHTASEAAAQIGRSKSSVARAASRLGITRRVGNQLALTAKDIARIAKEIKGIGNPNMVVGNKVWKGRAAVEPAAAARRKKT